jgi:hypothetical protein
MDKKKLAGKFVFAGGVVELLIAIAHFLMPFAIGKVGEISSLSAIYRNYVAHATIAVGLCMVCFGVLSIYFSQKVSQGDKNARVFASSQAVLWMARVVSELILPINVPLFFLSNPTTVILPMVIVITILFFVPTLLLRTEG